MLAVVAGQCFNFNYIVSIKFKLFSCIFLITADIDF